MALLRGARESRRNLRFRAGDAAGMLPGRGLVKAVTALAEHAESKAEGFPPARLVSRFTRCRARIRSMEY